MSVEALVQVRSAAVRSGIFVWDCVGDALQTSVFRYCVQVSSTWWGARVSGTFVVSLGSQCGMWDVGCVIGRRFGGRIIGLASCLHESERGD